MAQTMVEFVNLKQTGAGPARAAALLANWHFQRGQRVLILAAGPDEAQEMDRALWEFDPGSFLPHAVAGGEDEAAEPVLIALEPTNRNQAQVLIVARTCATLPLESYAKIIRLVPAEEGPELAECRAAFKDLRADSRVSLSHVTSLPGPEAAD
ncbi:MAG: DNA polymerase III subunit chi [Deltaproteobacteria bacterium]|nr:DNA polymerase III subunit chi [Deltaproteobacteria bacterium]